MVKSFDDYSSYLAIVDECTRYICLFLCRSKHPPIGIMNEFLTKFGLPQGGMIRCDEGGELSRSQEFREKVLEFHYTCEPTGADTPEQNGGIE